MSTRNNCSEMSALQQKWDQNAASDKLRAELEQLVDVKALIQLDPALSTLFESFEVMDEVCRVKSILGESDAAPLEG